MKTVKIFAIFAIVLFSLSVRAVCPTQETTVMFVNGIWTPETGARFHMKALERETRKKGLSPDCVHFELSHTQDNGTTDIAEAVTQKAAEMGINFSFLARALFFVLEPGNSFVDTVISLYGNYVDEVIDTQLATHLEHFRDLALRKGHRGIIVTHSQGGLYGNALYEKLTANEQSNTRLVTVATPSNYVADNGPNTRLSRDGIANRFFVNALASGMITNTALCENETVAEQDSYSCHGFQTGYLNDNEAREQIVGDIVTLISYEPVKGSIVSGTVFLGDEHSPISGAKVEMGCSGLDGMSYFSYSALTDENGFYRLVNVLPGIDCQLTAISYWRNTVLVTVPPFAAITVNVTIYPLYLQ